MVAIKKQTVSMRLASDLVDEIDDLAVKNGVSRTAMISMMLTSAKNMQNNMQGEG